jgi:hypothetical protein
MVYPALATIFSLFVYSWVFINVGGARKRTGIKAPATTGNDEFERYYRVQINMVEQFVLFLPSLWLCAEFFSGAVAGGLGFGWGIGRILYALGYYKEAKKRGPGFGISLLCSVLLLLCAMWGVGVKLMG